jgi:translation initiation factor 6
MHVLKSKFQNNPNVGLYGLATDSYCLLPKNLKKSLVQEIKSVLEVPVYQITIYNTNLIGVFCVGNKDYLFVPSFLPESELKELEKIKDVRVVKLETKLTALGNNITLHDDRCLVNPELEMGAKNALKDLGFKVTPLEIAQIPTVGACTALNSHGCLLHMDVTNAKKISSSLKLPVNIGTVNFGSPYVRTGLILNSRGYIIGSETTGPETQRIDEALGYLRKA